MRVIVEDEEEKKKRHNNEDVRNHDFTSPMDGSLLSSDGSLIIECESCGTVAPTLFRCSDCK